MRKPLTALVAVLACVTLAACSHGTRGIQMGKALAPVGDDAAYSLHAADQTSGGKFVKIPDAFLKQRGYIVIHADAGGSPGSVLGVSPLLNAGETKDAQVKLKTPLKKSADVWAMIHIEDNNNTTFDFPNGDQAASGPGGVVTVKIHVTVR